MNADFPTCLQDDVQQVLKLQYYLQYVSIASLNEWLRPTAFVDFCIREISHDWQTSIIYEKKHCVHKKETNFKLLRTWLWQIGSHRFYRNVTTLRSGLCYGKSICSVVCRLVVCL